MPEPYEINVDPDLANRDALTIFVNYRVFDFDGRFLGATGVGLTVDAVRHLISSYQQRFQRTIYFVDAHGKTVLFGNLSGRQETDLRVTPGLRDLVDRILREKSGSYQFRNDSGLHLLNVNYIPELKWYLFVEKRADAALADIRQTLYVNLAVCLGITLLVLFLTHVALARYQRRIEDMAATDKLTGLLNRQAFSILIDKAFAEYRRDPHPISILLVDVDHFKSINDRFGHAGGDHILSQIASSLQEGLRASDIAIRWGGEEFLIVLKGSALEQAQHVAEQLRLKIEQAQFSAGTQPVSVTVSIGVSQYDVRSPTKRPSAALTPASMRRKTAAATASAWHLLFRPCHSTRVAVPAPVGLVGRLTRKRSRPAVSTGFATRHGGLGACPRHLHAVRCRRSGWPRRGQRLTSRERALASRRLAA
nr:sensor domain-containing diguanylate cyclase [Thiobacillus denitrificans]